MATVSMNLHIIFFIFFTGSLSVFVSGKDAFFYLGHCKSSHNICEQICENFPNGLFCSCREGYKLDKNGYSCTKIDNKKHEESQNDRDKIKVEWNKKSNDKSSLDIVLTDEKLPIKPVVINTDNVIVNRTSVSSNRNKTANLLNTIVAEKVDLKRNVSQPESESLVHHRTGYISNSATEKLSKLKPLPLVHRVTCDGVICKNNGTCIVEKTTTRCNCPLGFVGSKCEKKIIVKYPKFTGNGYMSLPILKNGYKDFDINIQFKPQANNGLLLFSAELPSADKDFFSITLNDGYVEFRFDCGTGSAVIKSQEQMHFGSWNRVRAKRINNEGQLWLNNAGPVSGVSKGAYSRITFRLNLFLGGYTNITSISRRTGTVKPFVGCVQELIINEHKYDMRNVPFIGEAISGLNVGECSDGVCDSVTCYNGGSCVAVSADDSVCLCPLGTGGDNCQQKDVFVHIPKFSGHSYLRYPGLQRTTLSFTEIELVFKPSNGDGLILYNGYTNDRKGDFISLAMNEGHLEFRFDLGTGHGVIRSLLPLALNQWHWARVSRTGLQEAVGGVNIKGCDHPCVGAPCMNGGECEPDKDIYTCYCPLGYANTNCEDGN
ncbi:hypothetical protein KUTeg_016309 [Tegillarca granosa]|uniref:Pikachurin n=1 Tax=Tegillarca granosa TaxID=220873 RepID=A0ABQ9EKH2_TEGGR|nr:hypothetical protein KUTeg_016309 [Tegillarca granosa]